ncbi:MAG: FliG C-terminal domain-containing protein [Candidatus Calescibacterium sp.]|nr:hypothetical protein [Candidatus Calescibacterium sp.]MDW8133137.1 FliG C-terminal domain-containing protein [Candidatus Calescibacterium sp.]
MDISELTPRQKTAIILTSLPPEVSNSILMSFTPEERRAINAEFPKVRNIPENIKQQVLNEFLQKNRQTISKQELPSVEQDTKKEEPLSISQNLDKLLGKNPTQQTPSFSTSKLSKPLDFLAAVNPKKVYWVLKNESNSTIALVLSQLSPAVAQRIMSVFPTSQQTEINKYLIGIRNPDSRVIDVVAKFIKQELDEMDVPSVGESTFVHAQQTTSSLSTTTPQVEKTNVATASIIISNKKIDFTDISLLKPPDMEHLLKLTNKNDWINALKGVSPEIADKILSLMPQVQAKVIKKELETAAVSKEDIIKSQRDILFKVKGLVTIGKVKIV